MSEYKPLIRSILLSVGRQTDEKSFRRVYEDQEGECFGRFLARAGYTTRSDGFIAFMKSIPDVCRVLQFGDKVVIQRVSTEESSHMDNLTIGRKKSKTTSSSSSRIIRPSKPGTVYNFRSPYKPLMRKAPGGYHNSHYQAKPQPATLKVQVNAGGVRKVVNPNHYVPPHAKTKVPPSAPAVATASKTYRKPTPASNVIPPHMRPTAKTIVFKPLEDSEPDTKASIDINNNASSGGMSPSPEIAGTYRDRDDSFETISNGSSDQEESSGASDIGAIASKLTWDALEADLKALEAANPLQGFIRYAPQAATAPPNVTNNPFTSEAAAVQSSNPQMYNPFLRIDGKLMGPPNISGFTPVEKASAPVQRSTSLEEFSNQPMPGLQPLRSTPQTLKCYNPFQVALDGTTTQVEKVKIDTSDKENEETDAQKSKKFDFESVLNSMKTKKSVQSRLSSEFLEKTTKGTPLAPVNSSTVSSSVIPKPVLITHGPQRHFQISFLEISSPTQFWFQFNHKVLEKLMDRLNKAYDNTKGSMDAKKLKTNKPVAVYFEGKWYRGEVMYWNSSDAFILFVDYGMRKHVELKDLRELEASFIPHSRMAWKGSMHGIQPPGRLSVWDLKVVSKFKKNVANRILYATVRNYVDGYYKIDLTDDPTNNILYSTQMMSKGLAESDGSQGQIQGILV